MSKADELRKLYNKIELDTTEERKLLSNVKNGRATRQEINDLLDILRSKKNGGKLLDDIKDFENALITDINNQIDTLKEMGIEDNEIAHIEDEEEKLQRTSDLKRRYKRVTKQADETIEAIKIAYFQIDNFDQFENQLYDAKDRLLHLE